MRELLYLSQRKLRSFYFQGAVAGTWTTELQVEAPFITGRLGFTPRTDDEHAGQRRLEKIVRYLDRQAVGWTDQAGLPGRWVRFDLPMGFSVFSEFTGSHPVALFAGSTDADDSRAFHLLLCGSPAHLVGAGFQHDNYWASQGRHLDKVASSLEIYEAAREYEGEPDLSQQLASIWPSHERVLHGAYRAAARDSPRRTRAHLSGHARALMRTEQGKDLLLVATPLYVQYGGLLRPRRFLRRR